MAANRNNPGFCVRVDPIPLTDLRQYVTPIDALANCDINEDLRLLPFTPSVPYWCSPHSQLIFSTKEPHMDISNYGRSVFLAHSYSGFLDTQARYVYRPGPEDKRSLIMRGCNILECKERTDGRFPRLAHKYSLLYRNLGDGLGI